MEGRACNSSLLWKLQIWQKVHIPKRAPTTRLIINIWKADILLNYFYICITHHQTTSCIFQYSSFKRNKKEYQKPREELIGMAMLGGQGSGHRRPSLGHWHGLQVGKEGEWRQKGWTFKQPWPSWGLTVHAVFRKAMLSKSLTPKG